YISHPPNTKSSKALSGTNSWIRGDRFSVLLPSRMVPSCVSEPTGCDLPFRTSSTPAMNVVLTAPMPASRTPSSPFAAAIFAGFSIPLLRRTAIRRAKPLALPLMASDPLKQTSNDARSMEHLQTRSHLGNAAARPGRASRFRERLARSTPPLLWRPALAPRSPLPWRPPYPRSASHEWGCPLALRAVEAFRCEFPAGPSAEPRARSPVLRRRQSARPDRRY